MNLLRQTCFFTRKCRIFFGNNASKSGWNCKMKIPKIRNGRFTRKKVVLCLLYVLFAWLCANVRRVKWHSYCHMHWKEQLTPYSLILCHVPCDSSICSPTSGHHKNDGMQSAGVDPGEFFPPVSRPLRSFSYFHFAVPPTFGDVFFWRIQNLERGEKNSNKFRIS